MIQYTYLCYQCMVAEPFSSLDGNHVCPICKGEMEYWVTEEIDETTGKVINPGANAPEVDIDKILSITPSPIVVECPYCHSKNTSKISIFSKVINIQLGGMYGAIKANKNWQCDDCGSEW